VRIGSSILTVLLKIWEKASRKQYVSFDPPMEVAEAVCCLIGKSGQTGCCYWGNYLIIPFKKSPELTRHARSFLHNIPVRANDLSADFNFPSSPFYLQSYFLALDGKVVDGYFRHIAFGLED
jgi:hypothetical protein